MNTQSQTATSIYHRKGSKFWQARVRIGERVVRRSTHAVTQAGAIAGARAWLDQLQKRGMPTRTRCRADSLS